MKGDQGSAASSCGVVAGHDWVWRALRWFPALTDVAVISGSVVLAYLLRFGSADAVLVGRAANISHAQVGFAVSAMWIPALWVLAPPTYDRLRAQVGSWGPAVAWSAAVTVAGVAIGSLVFQVQISRAFLLGTFALGLFGLVATRFGWWALFAWMSKAGRRKTRVFLLGSERSVNGMAKMLEGECGSAVQVVGVCLPGSSLPDGELIYLNGNLVPAFSNASQIGQTATSWGARLVVVSALDNIPVEQMGRLLHEARTYGMGVASDLAPLMVRTQPIGGLPLQRIEWPGLSGGQQAFKTALDLVISALLLMFSLPVWIAVAVLRSRTQPALCLVEKTGLSHQPFKMLQFRIYTDGWGAEDGHGSPTRVGSFVRRFHVAWLPELFSVLRRDMSLVGPRPHDFHPARPVARLVRPGLTGIGESAVPARLLDEELQRLEQMYVENWSAHLDIAIAWRAIRSATRAYVR